MSLAVTLCATMAMAACDAGQNMDDVKKVEGALCVLDTDGNVFLEDKGGEVAAFCGAYEDGWSCRDGLCEQHLETIQGRIGSALVVGETQVNPLTKSRGPCVPLTLVACCSESDGCKMPDGSPYIGRWICAPEYIDEFGWVHTSAESMPCGAGQECVEEGVFPNVGLCQDIPSCVTDADCGDMDPCVDKECIGGKCVFTEKIGEACNDGDSCTLADTCVVTSPTDTTLVCVGTAKNCDDGNECTQDACDAATGECGHTNVADSTACDDGDKCTITDVCTGGICAGLDKPCDDENPCTVDSCDPTTGECLNEAVADSTACDDLNACTVEDACEAGECVGTLKSSDDENPCTADSCDPATGDIAHQNLADGTDCDDGELPTGDVCVAGTCIPGGDWCQEGDADECCQRESGSQHIAGVCTCDLAQDSTFGLWVISTSCGYYEQGNSCFNNAEDVPTCNGPCVPNCDGKVCGSDGCSGSCGACATGELCTTAGVCVECLVNADCGEGQECQTGVCKDLPPQPECTYNTDCPTGQICVNGVCEVSFPGTCQPFTVNLPANTSVTTLYFWTYDGNVVANGGTVSVTSVGGEFHSPIGACAATVEYPGRWASYEAGTFPTTPPAPTGTCDLMGFAEPVSFCVLSKGQAVWGCGWDGACAPTCSTTADCVLPGRTCVFGYCSAD